MVLVCLLVVPILLSEGARKFLFPAEVGARRFAKIGILSPEVVAPLVGVVEIVCGALILLGLFRRLAAVLCIVFMMAAILLTKVPVLLGHCF